jgi:hypothetical protein
MPMHKYEERLLGRRAAASCKALLLDAVLREQLQNVVRHESPLARHFIRTYRCMCSGTSGTMRLSPRGASRRRVVVSLSRQSPLRLMLATAPSAFSAPR